MSDRRSRKVRSEEFGKMCEKLVRGEKLSKEEVGRWKIGMRDENERVRGRLSRKERGRGR